MLTRKFIIICLILPVLGIWTYSSAQTVEDARKHYKNGQYATSVQYFRYVILDKKDMGYYTADLEQELANAEKCQSLLSSANSLAKQQKYSQAIEKYKQIKKLNPSDPNISKKIKECERLRDEYNKKMAVETDWNRCQSIEDYRSFRRKHPNSKYDQDAQTRIAQLERQADETAWRKAKETNTITAFEGYLKNYKIHESDAKRRLGDLYEQRANRYYGNSSFSFAKADFETAKKYKSLSQSSLNNYAACCEEVAFSNLKNAKERHLIDIQIFQSKYPNGKYSLIVNGYLITFYCHTRHDYDEARKAAKELTAATDDGVVRDKRWWQRYIKETERQYRKKTPSSSRSSKFTSDPLYSRSKSSVNRNKPKQDVDFMYGIGANVNFGGFTGRTYIGFEGTVSYGTSNNRFNAELAIRPCFEPEFFDGSGPKVPFICPITIAPRLNICRTINNSFYLYAQPEVGYAIGASWVYGGRVGLGVEEIGSIYFDALGTTKLMGADTNYASHFLFGSIGIILYIGNGW